MNIVKAKSAGFCFGVDRAVKLTYDLLAQGHKVATLGPLIHNAQCVADLESKGAVTANSLEEIPKGYEVVIRSHGVGQTIYDTLAQKGCVVHDATCPFVKKIQKIAEQCGHEGKTLLIAGDAAHPEVQGIVGHSSGDVRVFADISQLKAIFEAQNAPNEVICVAQTTYEVTKWLECREYLKKVCTNSAIFDTICSATSTRQQEAEELSRTCEIMVIVGGRHSSNTQKLVSVAAKHAKAIAVETAADLDLTIFKGVQTAGVTAGASTPSSIIEEVLSKMSEVLQTEELSFEEMLEQSFQPVFRNKILKGVVTAINPNEIFVDIGAKQTGIVKLDEMTDDPSAKMEDLVKIGDELELVVIKTNDVEGLTTLSKKRIEAKEGQAIVEKAAEDGSILEVYITEAVKGGLVAMVKGVKVFIPASQATLRRGEDFTALVKTKVNIKIIECAGRRVIGSIRAVLSAEADAAKEKFWADVEVGKTYTGVVKSLTAYGAFVDIGGVDGLVHISELSWNRIKHPSEVVSVGDTIEVYVKELDAENKKVSLGYKKTEDNPWELLKNNYPVGSTFKAPVVSITKFGAFVRILPGIDGLVHISEISNERVEKVSDVLEVGKEVEVKLTEVDFEKKRISLSMKALLEPVAEEADAE
ncbi:MAG: bifunctional 4-hydroxy-3-methylbut-2-enyl diphosphate reductase/30S ribosomal protein S1 [Oscillospiraceae bacterium]|nr:bifunctional 4-hydroxy-3-methylbut-2-enyl diphosphate reductase/30S ribosomal protein S1 [Oscillospiraceae bacterium]